MKKTYKANKNHPELKVGTAVERTYGGWQTEQGLRLPMDTSPNHKPEWYDEVVEEENPEKEPHSRDVRCKNWLCTLCNTGHATFEEPTVSDDCKCEIVGCNKCNDNFSAPYFSTFVSDDEVQKVLEYTVVVDNQVGRMEQRVMSKIQDGWTPIGGMSYTMNGTSALACQAMTRTTTSNLPS